MRTLATCWLICFMFGVSACAAEFTLTVEEPSGVVRTQWPVTSGVPFAEGALRDEQTVALFDDATTEVPLQTEVLTRWKDGSIRWLLLDFQVDLQAHQKSLWSLKYGAGVRRSSVAAPLHIQKKDDGQVVIGTGPVRLEYDPRMFQPQGKAFLEGAATDGSDHLVTINCDAAGIVLRDTSKIVYRADNSKSEPAQFTIEQNGPLRSCLRVEGVHSSSDAHFFRYVARIHAYRGQPWIRVQYTFINDYQDALMADVQELKVQFYVRYTVDESSLLNGTHDAHGRIFQVDERHYQLDGKLVEGQAKGWAAVGGEQGGMAVGLRQFWQNWPKAIECNRGLISLKLCPTLPEGLYDGKPLEEENKLYYALQDGHYRFKIGVAKTHEFFVNYFAGHSDAEKLERFFQAAETPLLATVDPEYACATMAMGSFPAAASQPHGEPSGPQSARKTDHLPDDQITSFGGYDRWVDRALDRHLKRRDQQREYGMLNFGDWFGERRVNWGNLEYDLAHGMFTQYLRTGDRRYFDRGEQAARHHTDVDVVHATNPFLKNPWGAPPQVGEVWLHCLNHTGGYYMDTSLPVSRTYHMGHSTNYGHVWSGGDFEFFLLTGDRRAHDVALQISDAMARHCPTSYGTHIRALGWPIVLVLNAYEVTGDEKYLEAATACWEVLKKNIDWQRGWVVKLAKGHCMHPEPTCYGNVPFMEGLTISALARYHRATGDPDVLRAMTVGIDQMIRECWVEEDKAFRYTACPLSTPRSYTSICLAAEGMAYESQQTDNPEHRRILREGILEMMRRTGSGDGKSLGQLIHFTPFALDVLRK